MNIRLATRLDIQAFYPGLETPSWSIVMEKGQNVLGIAGILFADNYLFAYSSLKDEARLYKKTIMRGAHLLQAMMEQIGHDVYAQPDCDEPNADQFLLHIGFVPDDKKGEFYVYRTTPR